VRPSEFSDQLLGPGGFPPGVVLSELASRSECSTRQSIALCVRRSHCAVGHFPGFVVFPQRGLPVAFSAPGQKPLCEFRLPPEYYPTDPSRPAAASQPLSWAFAPFSTDQDRRSTSSQALPARYVPSSGFGHPLDGLLPAIPSRFYLTPAALMGFALRSLIFQQVSERFRPEAPTYRWPAVVPIPNKSGSGRPVRPRFLGFIPAGSSVQSSVGLAPRPAEAPLGFTLPGHAAKAWTGISPDLLSHASPAGSRTTRPAGVPESRSAFA